MYEFMLLLVGAVVGGAVVVGFIGWAHSDTPKVFDRSSDERRAFYRAVYSKGR